MGELLNGLIWLIGMKIFQLLIWMKSIQLDIPLEH